MLNEIPGLLIRLGPPVPSSRIEEQPRPNPKSSDSSDCSGRAAQLIATNDRGDAAAVDEPRHDFLADPRLALETGRRFGSGDARSAPQHVAPRGRCAEHAPVPEQLLESELFGFERGAFTGAQQAKPGQIELASGGVLFLDEVTEMTPGAQAKVLRVLQEREFVRLGGTRPVKANVRVIAATNRDLHEAVAQGQFRADLYYRLNVFDIYLPPLRQRREDIPALAAGFLREFDHAAGRVVEIMPEAIDALRQHDWPGNVRELRNVIERATIMSEDGWIRPDDLSLWSTSPAQVDSTDLEVIERRTVERVMRETNGNKVQASKRLGISRMQLYCRLRKHRLETRAVEAAPAADALAVP